jgi:prepilin-type N-terminal cleavage/methylation domain-containing protein
MSAPCDAKSTPTADREHVRDRGFSIVEVVMAIAILSVVLLPVLDAVFTNVKASALLSEAARVETVLQNAADRVNRAPKKCDYAVYVSAAAQSEGWPADSATVRVWRYEPAANPALAGTWIEGACAGSTPTDLLVQKMEITVSNPTKTLSRTIQVVKSDV